MEKTKDVTEMTAKEALGLVVSVVNKVKLTMEENTVLRHAIDLLNKEINDE
ncbi:hypothetical protein HN682_05270 [Candidatus Peregrinibacteria bacterium]|nr:hypothetical protein [Candidatus Peregrinibacteria bacterium]